MPVTSLSVLGTPGGTHTFLPKDFSEAVEVGGGRRLGDDEVLQAIIREEEEVMAVIMAAVSCRNKWGSYGIYSGSRWCDS